MRRVILLFLMTLIALSASITAGATEMNTLQAAEYFKEVKAICDQDGGQLWGVDLYGPMLFVDRNNRKVIANAPDTGGLLVKEGDVYTGFYPDSLPIANTALEWNGTFWTMVIWQALSENQLDRNELIMHELWHRIQKEIGFESVGSKNAHLNKLDSRILLKMEWLALAKALEGGAQQKAHLQSALFFRNYRRQLYPGSGSSESVFEMHEGLASYTGLRLCGATDEQTRTKLSKQVNNSIRQHSFLMSFAYTSGPLYGYLLDKSGMDWRNGLTQTHDFGDLMAQAYDLQPLPADWDLKELYQRYDTGNVVQNEKVYELEIQAFISDCEQRFVSGSRLVIPMTICRISFDPRQVVPLGEHGTVYKILNAFGEWGTLEAENGALVSPDWSKVIADAPEDGKVSKNWNLKLNPGWMIKKSEDGCYYLSRE